VYKRVPGCPSLHRYYHLHHFDFLSSNRIVRRIYASYLFWWFDQTSWILILSRYALIVSHTIRAFEEVWRTATVSSVKCYMPNKNSFYWRTSICNASPNDIRPVDIRYPSVTFVRCHRQIAAAVIDSLFQILLNVVLFNTSLVNVGHPKHFLQYWAELWSGSDKTRIIRSCIQSRCCFKTIEVKVEAKGNDHLCRSCFLDFLFNVMSAHIHKKQSHSCRYEKFLLFLYLHLRFWNWRHPMSFINRYVINTSYIFMKSLFVYTGDKMCDKTVHPFARSKIQHQVQDAG